MACFLFISCVDLSLFEDMNSQRKIRAYIVVSVCQFYAGLAVWKNTTCMILYVFNKKKLLTAALGHDLLHNVSSPKVEVGVPGEPPTYLI